MENTIIELTNNMCITNAKLHWMESSSLINSLILLILSSADTYWHRNPTNISLPETASLYYLVDP